MPKRTKNMIGQVNELMDRVQMYVDSVIGNSGKNGRPRQTGSAVKSRMKWSRVAKVDPVSEEFEGSDLEDWGTDSGMPNFGAEYAKEWAMLWDAKKEQELDRMVEVIAQLRDRGATRSEVEAAWRLFESAQCK